MPVRQALVVEFIERKEHMGNAIALNSAMFNVARLIGPALAGFIIAKHGADSVCYTGGWNQRLRRGDYVAVRHASARTARPHRPATASVGGFQGRISLRVWIRPHSCVNHSGGVDQLRRIFLRGADAGFLRGTGLAGTPGRWDF